MIVISTMILKPASEIIYFINYCLVSKGFEYINRNTPETQDKKQSPVYKVGES